MAAFTLFSAAPARTITAPVRKRAYEGAKLDRHTEGWVAPGTSADAEIVSANAILRSRARDLCCNSPIATKAKSVWVSNLIGDGVYPKFSTGSDRKNADLKVLFDRWASACDADGQLDLYGLQALVVGTIVESGEALVRRRVRRVGDGFEVPLQLQVLEPDFIDTAKVGDNIRSGIEFDAIGRRRAYWLFKSHPGDTFGVSKAQFSWQSSAVPADQIAHAYEMSRTQSRGVTWFAPVIRKIRDIEDYDFSERVRKKLEACLAGVVFGDDDLDVGINPDSSASGYGVQDINGNLIERFEPGMFVYARGGKDIKFNQPVIAAGQDMLRKLYMMDVAMGMRMPYELLFGDLNNINYSSMRASLTEYRRLVRMIQHNIIWPMLLRPIERWFLDAVGFAGLMDVSKTSVEWVFPKFDLIDPKADMEYELDALRSGVKTFQELCAERGTSMEERLDEIEAFQKSCAKRGVVLSSIVSARPDARDPSSSGSPRG